MDVDIVTTTATGSGSAERICCFCEMKKKSLGVLYCEQILDGLDDPHLATLLCPGCLEEYKERRPTRPPTEMADFSEEGILKSTKDTWDRLKLGATQLVRENAKRHPEFEEIAGLKDFDEITDPKQMMEMELDKSAAILKMSKIVLKDMKEDLNAVEARAKAREEMEMEDLAGFADGMVLANFGFWLLQSAEARLEDMKTGTEGKKPGKEVLDLMEELD